MAAPDKFPLSPFVQRNAQKPPSKICSVSRALVAQRKIIMEYEVCVSDSEATLKGLSQISQLPYIKGEFSKFEDSFVSSGIEEDLYTLKGPELEVLVRLEKYEGYFFVKILGNGSTFNNAKKYLSTCN